MNKFKFHGLLAILSISVLIGTSCEKDDDNDPTNQITITIEEPVNGEKIAFANCGDVHIHVDIEASDENHEVEIVLHPEGDTADKIIDYDAHAHDKVITFEQEIDLCAYPAGTCFHLEVEACIDHDCEEKASAEAEFCLQ